MIVGLSVGLGFFNEYRSEKAVEALHSQIRQNALVIRDGSPRPVDVVELVPGDIVRIRVGDIIPADIRLLDVTELECDEAVLTGESMPVEKSVTPVDARRRIVRAHGHDREGGLRASASWCGPGRGTEFGAIAVGLGERHSETAFQVGLRKFSFLLGARRRSADGRRSS